MKNMMTKSTLREIRGSFSRWLAILGIIALGVGFFSGLKVTKEAFTKTGNTYLQKLNMFDYELISTLGIDDKNVEVIRNTEGVLFAEGSYSTDALIAVEGDEGERVAKMHSITENINLPELEAGRMPETGDECLVDHARFSEGAIGSKITICKSNDKDTRKMFAYKEYTIVGLAESPLYLNFERGSTSLGNGSVNCFVYIPEEGWDSEFFTEMYVKLTDSDQEIFSQAYKDRVDSMEDTLTVAFEACAFDRYDEILDEANEKLADAEKELQDAKDEVENGKKEIADNEKKIKDGEKEVRDNEKKIRDSEKEIADNEKLIADNEEKLADSEKELEEGKAEIEKAEKEIADNEKKLEEAEKDLEDGEKEYEDGVKAFEAAKKEAYKALEPLEAAMLQTEGTPMYDEYKAQYDAAKAEIDKQLKPTEDKLAAAKKDIDSGKADLEKGKTELETGKTTLNEKKTEIADAEKQIEDGKKELEDGKKAIKDGKKEIRDGKKKLADAKKEIRDGKKELEEGKEKLADAEIEIADAEKELKKAKKKVKDISEPDTYVLTRNTNIGYVCFDNDTSIVQQVAKIFPIFFFMVAALVVMTTMTRMIDEQRTQIGVLKALGYSRRRIMGKYLFYTVSAAVVGGVSGFFIGSYLFPWVIWAAYGMMYSFSALIPVINFKLGAATVLAAVVCVVSATIYSCISELREVPAELIRPKAPAFGKRILLERIGFIWKRLPFLHKVSLRNIFRYKKRFVMMLLGICGCTALLVTGMGISDSIKTVVTQQYEEIFKVDYVVSFDDPITREDGENFLKENSDVADKALYVYAVSMDADSGDSVKSVNVVVYDEASNSSTIDEFIDLHTEKGEKLSYPGTGECIINANLAQRLGLEAGDTISVHDSDMNTINAKIAATCENFVYNYLYINSETYEEQMKKPFKMNSAYVLGVKNNDPEKGETGVILDVSADGAKLMNADNVTAVSVTKEFKDRVERMMSALDYVVLLVIACAGALAFIVLYNLTNINITERIREIATIKVLGFNRGEVSQYVFRENIVLAVISALVGLPIGKLLHSFVMSQIMIDMISFDVRINTVSYVLSFIATLVFAVIVNFALYFKLDKINMAESLKSVE